MRLSQIKSDLNLVFNSVDTDELYDIINNLPDETDYSLAISIVSNYIAERCRDNNLIQSYYKTKAFYCEKSLEQFSFQWLIDNGYEPVKVLNKFKTEFNVVIRTNNPKAEKKSFFKPTPLAEENIYTQTYKGYKLHQTTNDLPLRTFQENKSRKLLEIKELPSEVYDIYKELLLKESYDSKSGESLIEYNKRINTTVEEVKELGGYQFNNYNKQSGARNYSLMRYITGNKFISSLVQASKYHTLTKANIDSLKYWLYVTLVGKETKANAIKLYDGRKIYPIIKKLEDKVVAKDITIKELGKYLRVKEAYTCIKNGVGFKTKFLLDWDGVGYGFVSLANNLRTKEILTMANLYDKDTINDSHNALKEGMLLAVKAKRVENDTTELQELEDRLTSMSRDEIKPINTVVIHGGMMNTVAKTLDMPLWVIREGFKYTLGSNADVPYKIAQFGREIHKKGYGLVSFPRPNGFGTMTFGAYSKRTKIPLEYKGYKFTIIRDAPILKGLPREHIKAGPNDKKEAKVNGLFAQICHVLDNYYLHKVYRAGLIQFDKFDAYYGWDEEAIIDTVFEALEETKTYLKDTLEYLSKKYGVPMPNIEFGDEEIVNTKLFIMP